MPEEKKSSPRPPQGGNRGADPVPKEIPEEILSGGGKNRGGRGRLRRKVRVRTKRRLRAQFADTAPNPDEKANSAA